MQHLFSPALTLKHLDPEGTFRGYASTRDLDLAKDQIVQGAFQKTLDTWQRTRGRFPYLYWQHDPSEPIGLSHNLYEDEKGLVVEGKLVFDFPKAREAFAQLQRGKKGLSIGFYVINSSVEKGIRKIKELALEEISFVDTPCNPYAQVQEYKAVDPQEQLICEKIYQISHLLLQP